jgi:hypothetical protein
MSIIIFYFVLEKNSCRREREEYKTLPILEANLSTNVLDTFTGYLLPLTPKSVKPWNWMNGDLG